MNRTARIAGVTLLCMACIGLAAVSVVNALAQKPLNVHIEPVILRQVAVAGDAHTGHRRRPQAVIRNEAGEPVAMLLSLREDRDDGVSISTAIAWTDDAGETWRDGGTILDRITGVWQGDRAFGKAITPDGDGWAMMSCGNDETGQTPGIRSVGLWRSDDLLSWTPHPSNPIITVDDLGDLDADMPTPAVGVYAQHMQLIDGVWHMLITLRGDHARWTRSAVMRSDHGLEGPWRPVGLAVDESTVSRWWRLNDNLLLSDAVRIGSRWYAIARNGVGARHQQNDRFAIAVSDDYLTWRETGWQSRPMMRSNGSPIVAANTVILAPGRILVSGRGNWGQDAGMYRYTGEIDGVW